MLERLAPVLLAGLILLGAGCRTTAVTPVTPASGEPPNLYLLKQEIKTYIDDGRYETGMARVAAEARSWIEQRAARGGKLAVVFDIDETTLSNLKHMREMDFGYVPNLWDQWVADGDAPPIASVLEVYRTARAHGVAVFFMTGRRAKDEPGTVKNLRDVGYGDYAGLYLKPNDYRDTTQSFKTATRKQITEMGYTIIANVGDQQSDLDGGYAEKTFKLPNPFYITK